MASCVILHYNILYAVVDAVYNTIVMIHSRLHKDLAWDNIPSFFE